MVDITDEFMREMLPQSKPYTIVFLKATAKRRDPGADAIAWEHGRRNFALRAEGTLAELRPVTDDSLPA